MFEYIVVWALAAIVFLHAGWKFWRKLHGWPNCAGCAGGTCGRLFFSSKETYPCEIPAEDLAGELDW